jgi:hypothetical protein
MNPTRIRMERKHFLAAELFGYSFANYANHLGVNRRFDSFMPREVTILETAEREAWSDARVSHALERDIADIPEWREQFRCALAIVDAPTPAESFRRGVRDTIQRAIAGGLESPTSVEALVTQVCYRAADLAVLLDRAGKSLDDYSEELRAEGDNSLRLVD